MPEHVMDVSLPLKYSSPTTFSPLKQEIPATSGRAPCLAEKSGDGKGYPSTWLWCPWEGSVSGFYVAQRNIRLHSFASTLA